MDLYHHSTPFFTQWVTSNGYLHEPFVVVDAGVQGGPHPRWKFLGDQVRIYGFDPLGEVIEALNKTRGPNEVYRAIALGNKDGRRDDFRVQPNTFESSFYGTSAEMRTVNMRKLDTLFAAGEIPPADHIKLDCEGFEAEIIRGARTYLTHVLCVTAETNFGTSPVYPRTPAADICGMLAEQGLLVFDFSMVRAPRPSYMAALAKRPWPDPNPMQDTPRLDVGQPSTCDFLFCRDLVAGASMAITADRLIKAMINFELHGLMDCAVELAHCFYPILALRFEVGEAIEHLIKPPPHARNTVDVIRCLEMIASLRDRATPKPVTRKPFNYPLSLFSIFIKTCL